MKIGQNPDIANSVSQAAAKQQQAKAPAAAAEAVAKTVSTAAAGVPVTFSSTARGVDATARGSAEFDAGKVKAVKAAIDKGTFTVDAEAIADKLLSNAQETFSRSRG
ncbi:MULTISPECIES: flagellar biosynthesis anti-sigma factor FlgM [unclassified Acidovorax]|uniref:flagellar biosynthesis anti-sigma factor FlgM n=1 Tax=unclassified Acidovorax TaxID=2684926 RepID=UPI0010E8539D|nr:MULTISPECIES: flagellar biosynthesis anti-sigma factor FlgM [unclassified Acidovorax]RYF68433.1 MAG: flagellar biosynthesis anti-sigma factor FlgM [Comamonadaceae bacterium]